MSCILKTFKTIIHKKNCIWINAKLLQSFHAYLYNFCVAMVSDFNASCDILMQSFYISTLCYMYEKSKWRALYYGMVCYNVIICCKKWTKTPPLLESSIHLKAKMYHWCEMWTFILWNKNIWNWVQILLHAIL